MFDHFSSFILMFISHYSLVSQVFNLPSSATFLRPSLELDNLHSRTKFLFKEQSSSFYLIFFLLLGLQFASCPFCSVIFYHLLVSAIYFSFLLRILFLMVITHFTNPILLSVFILLFILAMRLMISCC